MQPVGVTFTTWRKTLDDMAGEIYIQTMTLDKWMLFRKVLSMIDNKLHTLVLHE